MEGLSADLEGLAQSDKRRKIYACGMCVKVCPYGTSENISGLAEESP